MANYNLTIFSWILFLVCMAFSRSSNAAYYNVVSSGARADGKTDSTQAFLKAWRLACNSIRPATIYVPLGTFLLKPVVFTGPCKSRIVFKLAGTLVAPSDYWSYGNSEYWILFIKVTRVSVFGGILDAKGAGYWACRRAGRSCPVGSRVCYGRLFAWIRIKYEYCWFQQYYKECELIKYIASLLQRV